GERDRPEPPPGRQDDDGGQDQGREGDPAELDPRHRDQREHARGQRMPDGHPDDPGQQLEQLRGQDDAKRGAVDRGPPAGHGERGGVVDLGQSFAVYALAHSLFPSFVQGGETPGGAGGPSSSRPASLICAAITPPARTVHWRLEYWRRASPARPRTGPPP